MFRWSLPLVGIAIAISSSSAADPATVTIALAGDSTVTDKAGWGAGFAKLVGPKRTVVNLARGGASTKSYRDGKYWAKVLEAKPQWVLIQFGHNDQPGKGPERETDPKTTYRDNLRTFIDEARAAGAKPVLVTSLVRRIYTPEGKIAGELEPYAEAARIVAAEKKVPLVDLNARSKELCEKLGQEKCKEFGPVHPKIKGAIDGTHLNEKGAEVFAALVAEELRKTAPALAALLK